jgi:hypothetical protein
MATTTNYSWTTPDDTALVKDGAAAIRSLGTAIDSTVFTNAGAAIAKTIVDAKGDIIAATAADTVSRLAVGANDTVLTADSSTATGLKWAAPASGGMTLISTTTLSGATTTVSSIPTTYNNLVFVIRSYQPAADNRLRVYFNGDQNTRYGQAGTFGETTNTTISSGYAFQTVSSDSTSTTSLGFITLKDYANTTTWKQGLVEFQGHDNTTPANFNYLFQPFIYNQTPAITSATFFPLSGNFTAGTVLTYGVK